MHIEITGLTGLILLIADVYAIINVVQSNKTSISAKVIWTVAIILMPFIGFIAWLFFGPRAESAK